MPNNRRMSSCNSGWNSWKMDRFKILLITIVMIKRPLLKKSIKSNIYVSEGKVDLHFAWLARICRAKLMSLFTSLKNVDWSAQRRSTNRNKVALHSTHETLLNVDGSKIVLLINNVCKIRVFKSKPRFIDLPSFSCRLNMHEPHRNNIFSLIEHRKTKLK